MLRRAHARHGLAQAHTADISNSQSVSNEAACLWDLDPGTAEALLAALIHVMFLRRNRQGAYVRADVD